MKRLRSARIVPTIGVAALLAGACGSGDDASSTDASAVATESAPPADDRRDGNGDGDTPDVGAEPAPATASDGDGEADVALPPGVDLPRGIDDVAGRVIPPASTRDEVLAEFGPIPTEWTGPLSPERVCADLPQDHLIAMMSWHLEGERFELLGDRCDFGFGNSGPVATFWIVRADDDRSAETIEFAFEDVRSPSTEVDIADRGEFHTSDLHQQLMVVDGVNFWEFFGPGTEFMPDRQFLDAAGLVIERFRPENRIG